MLSVILSWLGSLLGGPFAKSAVEAYRAKLSAENSAEKIAADLKSRELELDVQQQTLQNQIIIADQGRWWTAFPKFMIELSIAVYIAKIAFDKVYGHGMTDAPGDTLGAVMQIALVGMFGSYAVVNAARAIARRP